MRTICAVLSEKKLVKKIQKSRHEQMLQSTLNVRNKLSMNGKLVCMQKLTLNGRWMVGKQRFPLSAWAFASFYMKYHVAWD